MRIRTKVLIGSAGLAAVAAAGVGVAAAGGDDDHEPPIRGADLERATRAALAHTGEGTVTDTEAGDEDSYYEVEVTLEDGTRVDVQLDEGFDVVGSEADGPEDDAQDD